MNIIQGKEVSIDVYTKLTETITRSMVSGILRNAMYNIRLCFENNC